MDYRIETDTMGEMKVPADRYYGCQTARSLENFKIGDERMPRETIRALGILKKSAALTNHALGLMDDSIIDAISEAADEVIEGKTMKEHLRFTVCYWHTFRGEGSDPFGGGTMQRPWDDGTDSVENACNRARVAFEFFETAPNAL